MRPVEYFNWLLPPDVGGGNPIESRNKMTREQATAYPGALCIESSREVRMVGDIEADRHALAPDQVVAPRHTPSQT